MTKECPHCGVDEFGLWDLFKLTYRYSSPSECRNCGGLIRSSGLSRFLTLLTTTLLLVVGLLFIAPLVAEWVFVLALIALLPLPTMLFADPIEADLPPANLPPFIPDANNRKQIVLSGWNEDELARALADFTGRDISGRHLQIEAFELFENRYRLTFPEDISVSNLAALIHYLNYPLDLGSPEREITVAGNVWLNSEFAGMPKLLWGEGAIVYVPEGDEDFDVVYLLAGTGQAFAFSLNKKSYWRRVNDPRLPGHIKAWAH